MTLMLLCTLTACQANRVHLRAHPSLLNLFLFLSLSLSFLSPILPTVASVNYNVIEPMIYDAQSRHIHTFSDSNGVFLNELNLSWFFGYFSKYASRIASPESMAFCAGMAHVDWIIAICSGVNEVIIGITVGFFWQDAITPMVFF